MTGFYAPQAPELPLEKLYRAPVLVQILFLCGKPPADMTLGFIHIQHLPGLLRQGWIDLHEAIRYIFMYSAL